jgi:hypothetical protein
MKISTILPVAALAALALTAAQRAEDSGRRFTLQMTGAAEVPGPGDADGTGTAVLRVNPGQRQVCYTLTAQNIAPATAAHVHRTPPDPGPIVIPLDPPTDGSSEGCATVTRALAQEIIQNPTIFYVNVHNTPFPGGAIRADLTR